MRILLAAAALAAAMTMTSPRAEAANWCYESDLGMNCGFVSLQQCMEALWGVAVGTCQMDSTPAREIVRTQPRKRAVH